MMLPPPDDDGVDVTLIRWMLSLSPEERLDVLQGFVDSVAEMSLVGQFADESSEA
ncbi:MAG TPA: hypothetical protein VN253_11340 [Kofleriaceae bacterium]|nr:hypothetical protein [Kofleriaceae bacterium]